MPLPLLLGVLLMGLAGGPHCVAMCGAACGGVTRARRGSMLRFQLGRFAGYTAAGAAAGSAVESFAWLYTQTAALRPLWTLFHLGVLAWALVLVAQARQPAWVESAGRAVWTRVRPLALTRPGALGAGVLWVLMPCGLLYSALLAASLAGGAGGGALAMALFAAGSGGWLAFAPRFALRLRDAGNRWRAGTGTRLAGGLLALAAAASLWMDLAERIAPWCAS